MCFREAIEGVKITVVGPAGVVEMLVAFDLRLDTEEGMADVVVVSVDADRCWSKLL